MARDTGDPARRGSPFPPGPGPAVASRRLVTLAVTGILILVIAAVARGALSGGAVTPQPGVAWVLSPASNTVAIRLTSGGGPAGRRTEARSHLTVIEHENGSRPLRRRSKDGGTVRVPVPPGRRTRLLVRVKGPRPFTRTLTVTVPPALRVLDSGPVSGGLLVSVSSPLRRPHRPLCGEDKVSFPGRSRVTVARSPYPCTTRLRLTAVDGEQAVLPVTVPALPEVPLYSFASSADRAIYITVDDGWTPSREVLAIMRRTHLPVTAFLIQQAAQENLPYWRAFVQAGGMVGDHTVSHPNLTKLSLGSATVQWGEARRTLGRWFGRAPSWAGPVRGVQPRHGGRGLPRRPEDPGGLERHRGQRRHSYLERPAAGTRRDRAPALGPGPGPPARQAAEGHPRPAAEPAAAVAGQLRRHHAPDALTRRRLAPDRGAPALRRSRPLRHAMGHE